MATLTTSYQLLKSVNSSTYSKLRLYGKLDSQDVTTNTSTITLELRLYGNGGGAKAPYTYSGMFSRLYAEGNDVYEQTETSIYYTRGNETTIVTHQFTIAHSEDGSATNKQVSGRLYIKSDFNSSTPATIDLPQIKRLCVLNNISDFTFGNNIPISYTKYISDYTADLDVLINNIVCATRTNITSGSTLTLTASELTNCYNAAPNTDTPTVSFRLTTKNGTATIGSSTKTAVGTIPSSVQPPTPTVTLADYYNYKTTYGNYVQNKSKINGSITASGSTGASVSSYSTTINGQTLTGNTFTTDILNTSGSNTYTTTITDSRGRTATTTGTFTVLEYNDPTIDSFKVIRCDSLGAEDDEGSYIGILADASISPLGNNNSKSFKVQYVYEETWEDILEYNTSYTYNTLENIAIEGGFSPDNKYEFRLVAADGFGSQIAQYELPTAKPVLDFYKDGTGVAVGKVAQTPNLFEVAHNTKINGTLKLADSSGDNAIEVFDLTGTPRYDPTQSYSVGDYCIYNDSLYKCVTATTGSFDVNDWSSTNIMTEIGSGGGGGGGGTSNYNDLTNKPQINSVTLSGNKSLSDLGINIPTKTSDLTNDSGFITSGSLPTKTSDLTNDSGYITSSYHDSSKQDLITSSNKLDYSLIDNTPTIPTITLTTTSWIDGLNWS